MHSNKYGLAFDFAAMDERKKKFFEFIRSQRLVWFNEYGLYRPETENDQRIYDSKIAEKAVQEWANGLDVPAATKPLTFGELHEKFFDLTHDANRVGMDVEPKFDYAGFLRLNIYSSDSCTCSGLNTVGMLSMRVTYPALSRASSFRQWMMVRAYGAIIPRRSTGNAMTS